MAIEHNALVEIDLVGGKFAWEKTRGKPNWVCERLDRAFVTNDWWNRFPLCKLSVIHTISSDHDPISIDLMNLMFSMK